MCDGPMSWDKSPRLWLKQHVLNSLMVLESEPKSGSLLDGCWSGRLSWFHLEARGGRGVGSLAFSRVWRSHGSQLVASPQPDLFSCRQLSPLTFPYAGPCNDTRAPGPCLPRPLAVWSCSRARAWMSLGLLFH